MKLDELRRAEFADAPRVYLDHALRGAVPRCARLACGRALEESARGSLARHGQLADLEGLRAGLLSLFGWEGEGLAFTQNTSAALGALAGSMLWSRGDRVVLHEDEVPANRLPWEGLRARGVVVEVLPSRGGRLELQDLEKALEQGDVRLVSLSAVALPSGERRSLKRVAELTRAAGARLCWDLAQAAGVLELSRELLHADALVGCTRKWLLGPPDLGYLALREEFAETLSPAAPGAASVLPDGLWRPGARRFEGGAVPALTAPGALASLNLLKRWGLAEVEAKVVALSEEWARRVQGLGYVVRSPGGGARSGIVQARHPKGLPPGLEARLAAEGVAVRVQGSDLRVSAHFWNTSQDLEVLERALWSYREEVCT